MLRAIAGALVANLRPVAIYTVDGTVSGLTEVDGSTDFLNTDTLERSFVDNIASVSGSVKSLSATWTGGGVEGVQSFAFLSGDGSGNIADTSSYIGGASADLGNTSSFVKDVSADIGDTSSYIGGASANIGNTSSYVKNASGNLADTSSYIGGASADLGEVSSYVGGCSADIGNTSSFAKDTSAVLGNASSFIGGASANMANVSGYLDNGASTNIGSLSGSVTLSATAWLNGTGVTPTLGAALECGGFQLKDIATVNANNVKCNTLSTNAADYIRITGVTTTPVVSGAVQTGPTQGGLVLSATEFSGTRMYTPLPVMKGDTFSSVYVSGYGPGDDVKNNIEGGYGYVYNSFLNRFVLQELVWQDADEAVGGFATPNIMVTNSNVSRLDMTADLSTGVGVDAVFG